VVGEPAEVLQEVPRVDDKDRVQEQHLFQLSMDRSGDAIMWMGADAGFIYVNEAACRSLGYSRDELMALKVFDVDPNITLENWDMFWADLKAKGSNKMESLHRRKDGSVFPVEVTGNYVEFEGQEFNCAFAQDISERKRSGQVQSSVYKISEAVHAAESLEELFRTIHETITELMPAKNNLYIALFDEDSGMLTFPYFVDEFDETPAPKKLGKGLTEHVLRTGDALLASPEVFAELEKKGEVESIGAPSIDWLGVPLKVKEKTIGVLVVQSYTEGQRYTEEDKSILMFVSEQVAMAITRRVAEDALQESEEMFRSVVENAQSGIVIIDDQFRPRYANDETIRIIGYARDEFIGTDFRRYLDKESLELVADRYQRRQKGEDVPSRYEFTIIRKDGQSRRMEISSTVITNSQQRSETLAQIRDVTEQRQAEGQLKASLQEKEVLLREIHHRVKNNLQIISSLLNLQSQHVEDSKALEMFKESRLRVRSMAMVHEKLYRSKNLSRVDFKEYVQSLCYHLFQMYGVAPDTVALNLDMGDILLDINTAIPCGLLVSELISNALKHAFPQGRKGEVTVSMKPVENGDIVLEVRDNGVGLEEDLDLKNTESFGLQLVDMLTEQLQGTISIDRNGGTTFAIRFKELGLT
jgi:PAS domain S-box-containing protein